MPHLVLLRQLEIESSEHPSGVAIWDQQEFVHPSSVGDKDRVRGMDSEGEMDR